MKKKGAGLRHDAWEARDVYIGSGLESHGLRGIQARRWQLPAALTTRPHPGRL